VSPVLKMRKDAEFGSISLRLWCLWGLPMAKKQAVLPEPSISDVHLLRDGDEFLTTPKAAAVLDRSPKTLEYWRATGAGPCYYCQGRRVRYLRSDLIQWAMRHPVKPGGIATKNQD
jgi:hypothetical protein